MAAYKTIMRYVGNQGGVEYIYPDLPKSARRFVVHPIAAIEAATGLPIETHLHAKILEHVTTPGDPIPGADWDPDYDPPPPDVPPPPVSWDAPPADRAAFLSAAVTLKNAINRNIARHYITHVRAGEMDGNIVQAVNWLFGLTERVRELTDDA